jgi:hypothetical protein
LHFLKVDWNVSGEGSLIVRRVWNYYLEIVFADCSFTLPNAVEALGSLLDEAV